MMQGKVTINAPLEVNAPVYAEGPVYVQGINIREEIEKLKKRVKELEKVDPEKIKKAVEWVLENQIINEKDKGILQNALTAVKEVTDWVGRSQIWTTAVIGLSDPLIIATVLGICLYLTSGKQK